MFYIYADGQPLSYPLDDECVVLAPKLTLEMGKAGSLEFSLPPSNRLYGQIRKLTTIITVELDDTEIFRGRVLSYERSFYNVKKVYCEGNLAYLVDSVIKGEKYDGTTRGLFTKILNAHNSRVEAEKRFTLGTVNIEDRSVVIRGQSEDIQDLETGKFDYRQIALNSIVNEWKTAFDYISECLIDYCGGYLRTRRVNGVTYLDYVTSYGRNAEQDIRFGENILDLTEEVSAENLFTVLIPLGDDNLTIESVNDGSDELVDTEGVAIYGRILRTHAFDSVNDPNTLLENGRRFLTNSCNIPTIVTIKGVDRMTYEEILCDANTLYRAYTASIKGSKWKEITQKFMLNYLRYIFKIQDGLCNRTLQNGSVEEFMLHERGRVRPITSIKIEDRIVRHALCDDILMPEVKKRIIYDNCASIKGRGMAQQRKRFEIHLHKYYQEYGNDGWILLGDFSKFYDNILHETAKRELGRLVGDDDFIKWLLDLIFDAFKVDVSYWSDDEYENWDHVLFNKLEHRKVSKELLTGEKWMNKSISIGDQLSQVIGIYYPYRIDNYIKYVRSQKYYGRYMDDWYIMNPSKEALMDMIEKIREIATEYGIHINDKKTKIVKISSVYKFLQVKYTLSSDGKIYKQMASKKIAGMRRKLKKLSIKIENGERAYSCAEEMFRSWMGSFYKLMTRRQRTNMIAFYEDLFNKKITIKNKKMIIEERSQ